MTLFTKSDATIMSFVEKIKSGQLGLPNLQRSFVWTDKKVCKLLDSLYQGYPVGFLLLWESHPDISLRPVGTNERQGAPNFAILDGQQRLTSLYSVIMGEPVLRSNSNLEQIKIAFNPRTEEFAVSNAKTLRDRSFISDISEFWKPEVNTYKLRNSYLSQIPDSESLTDEENQTIEYSIAKLHSLPNQYQFSALTLSKNIDYLKLADIFLRINSEGINLKNSDFIMTIMSVFWEEGRAELEKFELDALEPRDGRTTPFNNFISPSATQMLRVIIGFSLKRSKFEDIYNVLRDRETVADSDRAELLEKQFEKLKSGLKSALNLENWHDFLHSISLAGFRGQKMITSKTAIIYSYVFYLIGLVEYGIEKSKIQQVIAEFFFMAALTARYTATSESKFEAELAKLRNVSNGEQYIQFIRDMCNILSPSYFSSNSLLDSLSKSSQNPSQNAYLASLVLLDAKKLYSDEKISDLLDPNVHGSSVSLIRKQLFFKRYLETIGITDVKLTNSIANLACAALPRENSVRELPPAEYVIDLDKELVGEQREEMYFWHALPPQWWDLEFTDFLEKRRKLLAKVIEEGWKKLRSLDGPIGPAELTLAEIIAKGESDSIEFKSTLRVNLRTGERDPKMEFAVLKSIVGFLNASGGTLLIGVSDDGAVLGIGEDGFENTDRMSQHLTNLINSRIGTVYNTNFIKQEFQNLEGDSNQVLIVRCHKSDTPAFLTDGNQKNFFLRIDNTTRVLQGIELTDYIKRRFN